MLSGVPIYNVRVPRLEIRNQQPDKDRLPVVLSTNREGSHYTF